MGNEAPGFRSPGVSYPAQPQPSCVTEVSSWDSPVLENQAPRPLEGGRSSADEILRGLMETGESVSPELFSSFQKAKQSMKDLFMEVSEPLSEGWAHAPRLGIFFLSFWPNPKIPLVAQMLKNLLPMQETQVRSLAREDTLEKGMVTHSSILAWEIPWTEEPGGL